MTSRVTLAVVWSLFCLATGQLGGSTSRPHGGAQGFINDYIDREIDRKVQEKLDEILPSKLQQALEDAFQKDERLQLQGAYQKIHQTFTDLERKYLIIYKELIMIKRCKSCDARDTVTTSTPVVTTNGATKSKHGTRLQKPIRDLDFPTKPPGKRASHVAYVAALLSGGAVIHNDNYQFANGTNQVVRIDQQGNVIQTLYTCNSCQIKGLFVVNDKLYVLHPEGPIVEVLIHSGLILQHYYLRVSWLNQCGSMSLEPNMISDPDLLLLTDFGDRSVFTYRLSTREKQVKIRGLSRPYSVTHMASSNDGTTYVVCDYGGNVIKTFNASWYPLKTFGGYGTSDGQLRTPIAAIISPDGTIFVADIDNRRVPEFTTGRRFIRNVVTREDGVIPMDLSFVYPHLWVQGVDRLKRYQIYRP